MRQALRCQSLTPCLLVAAALPGLLCAGVAPAAIGCGFHPSPEVQLEGVYPGSFPVAVALRKTADKGVIDAAALDVPNRRGETAAQAVAAYGAAALAAFHEVEGALADDQLLARRLPPQQDAVTSAAEAVRIAQLHYRAGSRDLLWVSKLQTHWIAAEAALIRLQAQQRANRVRLVLALDGPA